MPRDIKNKDENDMSLPDKIKALNKKYGYSVIKTGLVNREKVNSGIDTLDFLMNGGYEKRSLILFHGQEGSLKTTISLLLLAEAQRRGDNCLIIDVEKGFDVERASQLGVNVNKVCVIDDPLSAEGYMEILCSVINDFQFVMLDSTTSMISQQVADKSLTDGVTRASLASALSTGLAKLNFTNKNSTIIMIGQERDNPSPTGAPTYLPGGKAQKFYANYRFQFKVVEYYDAEGEVVGKDINKPTHSGIRSCLLRMINKKNRRGEQQMAEDILFDFKTGKIDENFELLKLGERTGVIEKNGGWKLIPSVLGEKTIQSGELLKLMNNDKEFKKKLKAEIRKKI